MQTALPFPLARDDTLLGVCAALGEDLGFNPIWLRIGLGVALLWNPVVVIGGYLAAAAVVAVSRLIVPNPASATASAGEPVIGEPVEGNDNADQQVLAAAA